MSVPCAACGALPEKTDNYNRYRARDETRPGGKALPGLFRAYGKTALRYARSFTGASDLIMA